MIISLIKWLKTSCRRSDLLRKCINYNFFNWHICVKNTWNFQNLLLKRVANKSPPSIYYYFYNKNFFNEVVICENKVIYLT